LYFRLVLPSREYFLMISQQARNQQKESKTLNKNSCVLTVMEYRTSNKLLYVLFVEFINLLLLMGLTLIFSKSAREKVKQSLYTPWRRLGGEDV
jgi:hypothetical protein